MLDNYDEHKRTTDWLRHFRMSRPPSDFKSRSWYPSVLSEARCITSYTNNPRLRLRSTDSLHVLKESLKPQTNTRPKNTSRLLLCRSTVSCCAQQSQHSNADAHVPLRIRQRMIRRRRLRLQNISHCLRHLLHPRKYQRAATRPTTRRLRTAALTFATQAARASAKALPRHLRKTRPDIYLCRLLADAYEDHE